MTSISSASIFWATAAVIFLYLLTGAIYRLTFHPLAKFPGPKLAAITNFYGGAWDLPVASSYCRQWPKLHEKYGPIVRIFPNQLSVLDLDAYNQIFKPGTRFSKDRNYASYNLPVLDAAFFNKWDNRDAKPHKDLYQPYFSRTAVQKVENVIQENINKFLAHLKDAAKTSKVVDLSLGFKCLVADSIMQYCYDKPFGAIDSPDFKLPLIVDLEGFFDNATFSWYFQSLFIPVFLIFEALPKSYWKIFPPLAAMLDIQDGCAKRIRELQTSPPDSGKPTVFKTAINPDKEKGQFAPSFKGLTGDALTFFVAGTDTTSHALVTGSWHLIQNPSKLQKLQTELESAIPNKNVMNAGVVDLEKLPYLRGVVRESLRLSYGPPGKLPRTVPSEGAVLCGQQIPPGVAVVCSHYVFHMSEQFFTDAQLFQPERWLDPATFKQLDNALLSFSRGSRSCTGINLAFAELYNSFAYLFRNFDLENAGTTDHDMDWHDAFTPATFGHLKVHVKETQA